MAPIITLEGFDKKYSIAAHIEISDFCLHIMGSFAKILEWDIIKLSFEMLE